MSIVLTHLRRGSCAAVTLVLVLFSTPPLPGQDSQGARSLQALEAARSDAYRTLLETVMGVEVEGESTVRNLVSESSITQTSLDSFVRGAEVLREDFETDGSATVELELNLDRLERLTGRNIEAGVRIIRATGRGAPRVPSSQTEQPEQVGPSELSKQEADDVDQPQSGSPVVTGEVGPGGTGLEDASTESVPEWNTTVTVVGQAAVVAKDGQTPTQARLLGERAAVADAYRRLLEYVYGVDVSAETTVEDLCIEDDRIRSRVDAYVRGARVERTWIDQDVASAEVSLDLSEMKEILR